MQRLGSSAQSIIKTRRKTHQPQNLLINQSDKTESLIEAFFNAVNISAINTTSPVLSSSIGLLPHNRTEGSLTVTSSRTAPSSTTISALTSVSLHPKIAARSERFTPRRRRVSKALFSMFCISSLLSFWLEKGLGLIESCFKCVTYKVNVVRN